MGRGVSLLPIPRSLIPKVPNENYQRRSPRRENGLFGNAERPLLLDKRKSTKSQHSGGRYNTLAFESSPLPNFLPGAGRSSVNERGTPGTKVNTNAIPVTILPTRNEPLQQLWFFQSASSANIEREKNDSPIVYSPWVTYCGSRLPSPPTQPNKTRQPLRLAILKSAMVA